MTVSDADVRVIEVKINGNVGYHLNDAVPSFVTDYGVATLCGRYFKASEVVTENANPETVTEICSACVSAHARDSDGDGTW